MIPIVTIGLDEAGRAVADRIAHGRGVTHFDAVEDAQYEMSDALDGYTRYDINGGPVEPDEPPAAREDNGAWVCHVIYGEAVFGAVMTSTLANPKAIRLEHTGYTMALVKTLGEDPGTPRRVRHGQVDESADHRDVYSAVGLLGVRTFGEIDKLSAGSEATLSGQLDKFESEAEQMAADAHVRPIAQHDQAVAAALKAQQEAADNFNRAARTGR
jgi:hypothetical protein